MTGEEARQRVVSPELLAKAREFVDDWRRAVFRGEIGYFEITNEAMKYLLASFGDAETLRDWSPPALSSVPLRTQYLSVTQEEFFKQSKKD